MSGSAADTANTKLYASMLLIQIDWNALKERNASDVNNTNLHHTQRL